MLFSLALGEPEGDLKAVELVFLDRVALEAVGCALRGDQRLAARRHAGRAGQWLRYSVAFDLVGRPLGERGRCRECNSDGKQSFHRLSGLRPAPCQRHAFDYSTLVVTRKHWPRLYAVLGQCPAACHAGAAGEDAPAAR